MSARRKKQQKGPSWFEVGFGAFMSIILGVALGAAYLVNKPVTKVTAIPKDAQAGAVYYIEGERDFNKGPDVDELQKTFLAGGSVSISEGELNLFLGDVGKTAASGDTQKPADKAPAAPPGIVTPGTLNARIKDGKIQFASTVTITVLTVSVPLIVQATGTFSKHGSTFGFDPESFYVGGCPMQRFLFLRDWVEGKLLFAQPVPADLAAAWSKLVDVTIDSSGLQLKGPQG
jgi:hypothetical protein